MKLCTLHVQRSSYILLTLGLNEVRLSPVNRFQFLWAHTSPNTREIPIKKIVTYFHRILHFVAANPKMWILQKIKTLNWQSKISFSTNNKTPCKKITMSYASGRQMVFDGTWEICGRLNCSLRSFDNSQFSSFKILKSLYLAEMVRSHWISPSIRIESRSNRIWDQLDLFNFLIFQICCFLFHRYP